MYLSTYYAHIILNFQYKMANCKTKVPICKQKSRFTFIKSHDTIRSAHKFLHGKQIFTHSFPQANPEIFSYHRQYHILFQCAFPKPGEQTIYMMNEAPDAL